MTWTTEGGSFLEVIMMHTIVEDLLHTKASFFPLKRTDTAPLVEGASKTATKQPWRPLLEYAFQELF